MRHVTQGEYLRSLRSRAKLTQEAAAKKIGVDRPYLSRLEREQVGLGEKVAPRIARAYREPIERVKRYVRAPGRTEAGALLERVEALALELAELGDQQAGIRARLDQLEAERLDPESQKGGDEEAP